MMRMILGLALAAASLWIVGEPANAQTGRPEPTAITILTDGISDSDERGTRAIEELARSLVGRSPIRVLPMAGRGGGDNVRDLLYQRGVDFALLNGDVLAFMQLTGQNPDAQRRVRYVSQLFDQKVILLARGGAASPADLKGKRIAALGQDIGGHLTARTIFGLQRIDVKLRSLSSTEPIDAASLAETDALVLLGAEINRIDPQVLVQLDLRPVPIRVSAPLQRAYVSSTIAPAEIPGLTLPAQVETVATPTVLAVFDFNSSHTRFRLIERFIATFFSTLPELRRQYPGSIWLQTNVAARVPGWTRHPAAQPERLLPADQLAALSRVAPAPLPPPLLVPAAPAVQPPPPAPAAATVPTAPVAPPPPAASVGPAPVASAALSTPDTRPPLRLLGIARPPLSDPKAADGGLIADLVSRSLASAGAAVPYGRIELSWSQPDAAPVQALLETRATDVIFPWESIDCERPNEIGRSSALLCDQAQLSEPVMQVLIGLFTRNDGTKARDPDKLFAGRPICLPHDRDLVDLVSAGSTVPRGAVMRRASIVDCIGAVQSGEADGFVASDLEGQLVLRRLGLTELFRMDERPLATRGVHAAVSKDNPQAAELLAAINAGLAQLKRNDSYSSIVRRHLMAVLEGRR